MKLTNDLFLLMVNLSQLSDKNKIIQLFCESISELFKPSVFYYSEQNIEGSVFFEVVKTMNSTYGFIYTNDHLDNKNIAFLQNAIQMLAIIIERLNYGKKINQDKQSLTIIAEERLEKINIYVKELEQAKLASLNLVEDLTAEINAKEKVQTKLQKSEELFSKLFKSIPDIIMNTDLNGKIIFTNSNATKQMGFSKNEIIGNNISSFIAPYDQKRIKINKERILQNSLKTSNYDFVVKNGTIVPFEINSEILHNDNGIPYGFVHVCRDVTERNLAEEKIQSNLKEKEVLLQEVHHRVKNNLQLIISLLKLEMEEHEELTEIYNNTISRIRKFTNIHNKLYLQDDVSNINLSTIIKESAEEIISLYSGSDKNIKLIVDIPKPIVSIGKSIPIALIINELITNSMKYAFDNDGEIFISIYIDEDENINKFIFSDNGRGNNQLRVGFGTKMVNILADQLGLKAVISSENGTHYDFKIKESKETIISKEPNILYVEDEFIIALERISCIKDFGYSVNDEVVESGEKALQYMRESQKKPSLVIMDIGLAGKMNGVETAIEIRKESNVPIIFLTGYEDPQKQVEMSTIFNTSFLHKTCSDVELKEIIDKNLHDIK